MNPAALLAPYANRKVRAGLAGAGEFGASFLFRARVLEQLAVPAVADLDADRARNACLGAGHPAESIAVCATRAEALQTIEAGRVAIVPDAKVLAELPLDVIVEATGSPEGGARCAELAIAAGKHVAMVSKEAHSAIGPILQHKARTVGRVCTPVDGDQPSLLASLVTWAGTLGLEVTCAGKASEYDFVFDPATSSVLAIGETRTSREFATVWDGNPTAAPARARERARLLAGIRRRTAPDLCELGIVANATGLKPDTPELHAPVARTLELVELLRPDGGLLARRGAVDMFNCYRRPDELSFAGGVFVVVACDDPVAWKVIAGKGIPVSADGRYALLHNPVHLLGLEAPYTIFGAAFLGHAATRERPVCDMVARAVTDLPAGSLLALAERHELRGLAPMLADAAPATGAAAVPYYMAAGCTLRRAVAAGATLTVDDLERPADSTLWRLRAEQDRVFFGASAR